jgi:large repetitive protein
VNWTSVDDRTGSGVKSTTVYVSIDGADYQVWQQDVTTTAATYIGVAGRTYEFLALATDKSGNVERQVLLRDLSGNTNDGTVTNTGGGDNSPTPVTTNPLFAEAQQQLPASVNTTKPSAFTQVTRPFTSSNFVKNITTLD